MIARQNAIFWPKVGEMGVGQMGVGKWVPIPEEYSTTYSHNQKTDPKSARVSHTNDTLPYSNTV